MHEKKSNHSISQKDSNSGQKSYSSQDKPFEEFIDNDIVLDSDSMETTEPIISIQNVKSREDIHSVQKLNSSQEKSHKDLTINDINLGSYLMINTEHMTSIQKEKSREDSHSVQKLNSSQEKLVEEFIDDNIYLDSYLGKTLESMTSIEKEKVNEKSKIETFECNFQNCVFKCHKLDLFIKHLNDKHICETRDLIKCGECGNSFETQNELKSHKSLIHPESHYNLFNNESEETINNRFNRLFCCLLNNCKKTFKNRELYINHIVVNHSKKESELKVGKNDLKECEYCEQMFYTLNKLVLHKNNKHIECSNKCKFCEYKSHDSVLFRKHEKLHSCEEKFICSHEECDEVFKDRKGLINHMTNNHIVIDKGFGCDSCDQYFMTNQKLISHKISVHNQKLVCDKCDFFTKSPSAFKNHLKIHKKEIEKKVSEVVKDYICSIDGCNQGFSDKRYYLSHINKVHEKTRENVERIKCDECVKTFQYKHQMTRHKYFLHPKEYRFKCNSCNYKTNRKENFVNHKASHSNERPFKCEINSCKSSFKTLLQLRVHKHYHKKIRTLICNLDSCGKAFKTLSELKSHKISHKTEKPHVCDWPGCEARFKSIMYLNRHKNTHIKTYKCEWNECDIVFKSKESLKYHLNRHKGVKPYSCDWPGCGSAFYHLSVKRNHRLTHTKPFKCQSIDCNQCFSDKRNLMNHMKAKH